MSMATSGFTTVAKPSCRAKELWETHRIACITYHKHPGPPWQAVEFADCEITLSGGEEVTVALAECGSMVGSPTIDSAAARRLLQDLFVTDADLRPDPAAGVLHVEIHRGSRPAEDRVWAALFATLNEMEITFPGTELILRYSLLGSPAAAAP